MNSLVNFILESGISLALLSLIYILFLRKETFFKLNRIFLLISVAFSIFLPFLKFRVYNPQPVMLAEITVTPYRNLLEAVTIYGRDFTGSVEQTISSSRILVLIYLTGLLFFFGRFIFRLIQIFVLIHKNDVHQTGSIKFVPVDKNFSPFSFLGYVFISPEREHEKGYEKMVAHEMEHIKQGHTFDLLVLEIMSIFQWFNPFMWILKRVIRENHEYLADQAVINSGINPVHYKQLLLNQTVGFQIEMANNFNSSLIKKRIKMISKIRSSKLAVTKIIFGILVASALVIAFACEQKESVEALETGAAISAQNNQITIKSTILDDGRIKIDGTKEDVEKFKNFFASSPGFEMQTDSLGNVYLIKTKEVKSAVVPEGENVFFIVEEMPEFPGGELALRKYIANTIKYPESAVKKGIQGKVYVTFVVTKDGAIANAKIARGVDTSLDKEALRVVNSLPQWKPGKQKGENVNVQYTVPINFVLQ